MQSQKVILSNPGCSIPQSYISDFLNQIFFMHLGWLLVQAIADSAAMYNGMYLSFQISAIL